MHRIDRFIMLAVFVVLAIYRLIRYTKAATTKGPRPAAPPTSGVPARPAEPAAAPASAPIATGATAGTVSGPLAPPGTGSGGPARTSLAAVLVWTLGNAAVWLCLFALPALESVPVIWRLVAGVLASFYLVVLARGVATRIRERTGRTAQMSGGNPFPD
jgi:hypothetical protein